MRRVTSLLVLLVLLAAQFPLACVRAHSRGADAVGDAQDVHAHHAAHAGTSAGIDLAEGDVSSDAAGVPCAALLRCHGSALPGVAAVPVPVPLFSDLSARVPRMALEAPVVVLPTPPPRLLS